MASEQKPKVYRLQGIPSDLQNADEVVYYLSERCPELADYNIQICSLAKALTSVVPSQVATVMFHHQKPSDDAVNCSLQVNPAEAISKVKGRLIIDEHFLGVTPFNDVGPDDYEYDCVAVSGIGSHPFGSWMPHDNDKQFMWIRDVLPKLFPSSRAMIYGYDTKLRDTNSFQQIRDLAITFIDHLRVVFKSSAVRRSIILIAHSLGGIVVKQALVMLAEHSHPADKSLLKAISGAVFFGVPNYGMVISHLLALAFGQPNNFLIEQIKENAPFLARLEDKFSSLEGYSFREKSFFWGYETQESAIPIRNPADGKWTVNHPKAPRLKLVNRDSATRGLWKNLKRHFTFQINQDHSNMVKFVNAHDPDLIVVIGKLSELFECPLPDKLDVLMSDETRFQLGVQSTSGFVTKLPSPLSSSTTTEPSEDGYKTFKLYSESLNIPEMPSLFGRVSEIAALTRILQGVSIHGRLVVSVHGPPGIGKTQLVAHYIKNYRDAYDNIFYIDGSNPDRLLFTLRREASRIRPSWSQLFGALRSRDTNSSNIERFCSFLNSDGNTKWLLIIDEMQDSPWITPIFDQLKQGTVILVSTSSQFTKRFPAVRLGYLDLDASDHLLLNLGPEPIAKANHHELLLRLDCHPTLIRLVAPKLIGFKTLSIFFKHWQDGEIKLPTQTIDELKSILQAEFGVALPATQMEILNVCLLFDYKAISYDFLECLGISGLESFFGNTIERLARHGLVSTRLPDHQSVTSSFSELFFQFIRQSINSWDSVVRKAASLLAEKVPRSHKDNYRKRIELLAPHAIMFSKYINTTQTSSKFSAEFLGSLERIASLLRLLNKDADAIKLYSVIHQHNTKLPPSMQLTPLRIAEVYNNMGLSCMNEGDMKLAQSCFGKAASALPQNNAETRLQIIANQARALMEMEEHDIATQLLSSNLESNKSMDKVMLVPLQHVLGFGHVQLGRADIGILLLKECLSVSESEHLRVGKLVIFTIMHDLATAWRDQKKWDDAITLYKETRECRKRFHGPTHRYTMETTGALAVAYQGSGQADEAAACFKEALKWQREKLRLNHPDTLQTLQNYGIFLSMVGDLEGAKTALGLAHSGWVDQDSKNKKITWNRINSGVSLALVLQDLADFKKAEMLYKKALTWYRAQRMESSPKMAYQYSKIIYLSGMMYQSVGQADQALATYERVAEVVMTDNDEASYWKRLAVEEKHKLDLAKQRKQRRALHGERTQT